jgi:hypothetical protein
MVRLRSASPAPSLTEKIIVFDCLGGCWAKRTMVRLRSVPTRPRLDSQIRGIKTGSLHVKSARSYFVLAETVYIGAGGQNMTCLLPVWNLLLTPKRQQFEMLTPLPPPPGGNDTARG